MDRCTSVRNAQVSSACLEFLHTSLDFIYISIISSIANHATCYHNALVFTVKRTLKLFLYTPPRHILENKTHTHTFLTALLDGGGCLILRCCSVTPIKELPISVEKEAA